MDEELGPSSTIPSCFLVAVEERSKSFSFTVEQLLQNPRDVFVFHLGLSKDNSEDPRRCGFKSKVGRHVPACKSVSALPCRLPDLCLITNV